MERNFCRTARPNSTLVSGHRSWLEIVLTVSGVSGFCWAFPNLYSMKTGLVPTWEHFQLNGGNYCTYHREIVSKFFFPTGNFYFTLEINSHSSGKLFPYLQWDVSNSLQINFSIPTGKRFIYHWWAIPNIPKGNISTSLGQCFPTFPSLLDNISYAYLETFLISPRNVSYPYWEMYLIHNGKYFSFQLENFYYS